MTIVKGLTLNKIIVASGPKMKKNSFLNFCPIFMIFFYPNVGPVFCQDFENMGPMAP